MGATLKSQAQKEIFIKQVDFKLDHVSDIDYENEYFVTLSAPVALRSVAIHASPSRCSATQAVRVSTSSRLARVDRIDRHELCVVHPAIGILEAGAVARFEGLARRVAAQVDGARPGQPLAPGQVVVEKQARADHPCRSQMLVVRQHETLWPNDVRRCASSTSRSCSASRTRTNSKYSR